MGDHELSLPGSRKCWQRWDDSLNLGERKKADGVAPIRFFSWPILKIFVFYFLDVFIISAKVIV